jgi:hypothetical protein
LLWRLWRCGAGRCRPVALPFGDSARLSQGQGFVWPTEVRQVPTGSEVDALHGRLELVGNTGQIGYLAKNP